MKARARRALGIGLVSSDVAATTTGDALRFLDRLDLRDVRRELAEAGVLSALADRGYRDPVIHLDAADGEHRLIVAAAAQGDDILVELRMREGTLVVTEPTLRGRGVEVLSVLVVGWLSLQDPRASFTAARPRLPGQTHPGLGLGRHLYSRVLGWTAQWGKDALVNVPAYFHNARFYAPPFAFVSPDEQGRFEALRRDLDHLPVAEASGAVDAGRVIDEAASASVRWTPGDMLAAVGGPVREYLLSDDYAAGVAAARESHRFRVV